MNFSDDTVMAYVDGELDAPTRARVEAAAAADPELARRIARQQSLRRRLSAALDPVLKEPVPERLLATVRDAAREHAPAQVVPLARRRASLTSWSWREWSALAASLVLGALLGPWLVQLQTGGPLRARAGELLADGALARALSAQLAGTQPPDAPVQIGVSFRARDGDYCRTFVLRDRNALAGLACRSQGSWRLRVLAAAPRTASEGYRPAAAALPTAVTSAVDELIEGEPLDAGGEAAARERSWNR